MYRHLLRYLTSSTLKATDNAFHLVARISTNSYQYPAISKLAPNFKGQAVLKGHFKEIQIIKFACK